ncbi:MAG: hypothetical protein ACI4P6_00580 [Candidatus Spyradosoma sp.]
MKKSLLIFVLFALSFVHFLAEAHAETTSIKQTDEVDWETVNWKEGMRKNYNPLSPEDAETMWKRIQKEPEFQALPQLFKDLIEHNKDDYKMFSGSDVNTFVVGKQGGGSFFVSKLLAISFDNRGGVRCYY